jgi:hypothetical protein
MAVGEYPWPAGGVGNPSSASRAAGAPSLAQSPELGVKRLVFSSKLVYDMDCKPPIPFVAIKRLSSARDGGAAPQAASAMGW